MRKLIALYLCVCALLSFTENAFTSSIRVASAGVPMSESFDSFLGTFTSLPTGFSVSKDGATPMERSDEDFRGIKTNSTTTGGCYAWMVSGNDTAMGCQPIAADFSPGWIMASVSNSTGISIREITVSYDIACRNNADRSSSINLETANGNGLFQVTDEAYFVSPEETEANADWTITHRELMIKLKIPLANSKIIYIRWYIDDAGGGGSRDELGINNFSITLHKPTPTVIMIQ